MTDSVYLNIKGLHKSYKTERMRRRVSKPAPYVLNDINLEIYRNECLGVIGESGCGKTTLGLSIVRLIEVNKGALMHKGQDLLSLSQRQFLPYRKRFQLIFQNPGMVLNPMHSVMTVLTEPLKVVMGVASHELKERAEQLLIRVGLDASLFGRFPYQLSGGQKQRVAIARAIAVNPEFLIADEPASNLDAELKKQMIALLFSLKERLNLTLLLISHDLSLISEVSERIAVMHNGQIIEVNQSEKLINDPRHPYTQALLTAANRKQIPGYLRSNFKNGSIRDASYPIAV